MESPDPSAAAVQRCPRLRRPRRARSLQRPLALIACLGALLVHAPGAQALDGTPVERSASATDAGPPPVSASAVPAPLVLVLVGLAGLAIFPDRIAPGLRVRRDPSSR